MAGKTTYTDEVAKVICDRIIQGESVRSICDDGEMPNISTVFKWLAEQEGFSDQYEKATAFRSVHMAEEILDICDDTSNDDIDIDLGEGVTSSRANSEHIARSRLRVDTRKWLMSKLQPKKYGDKIHHAGEDGGPIKHDITTHVGLPATDALFTEIAANRENSTSEEPEQD